MKKIFPTFILMILAFHAYTQQLQADASNGPQFWGHHYSLATNIKYGESDDQRLDIYSQGSWIGEPNYWKSDTELHPTLVYIHGGGWLGGQKNR